jgi:nucleotidyltransferase substrate binding protein (TIGR01987 family)
MLDLASFEKALTALEVALKIHGSSPLPGGSAERILMRDGVIQRFEFTFELSWKFLKRFLEVYGMEKPDSFTNKDLFRVGFEHGLLEDPVRWFHYLKMRNNTSHAYDETKAREVFQAAGEFLPDAQRLLAGIKEKMK